MPSTKLQLKGKLGLTINPVIHSFIEFLPLGRVEFIETLKQEIESNPMLNTQSDTEEPPEKLEAPDQLKNRYDRCDSGIMARYEEDGFLKKPSDAMTKQRAIELFGSASITLHDHLMEQAEIEFSPEELRIAEYIIYNLTESGYLNIELESIASSLKTTPAEMERIRGKIRGFHPLGVASKTLQECLSAQVAPDQPKLLELIQHHLRDLAESNYDLIMKKLQVDRQTLLDLIARLKHLNPKPGGIFSNESIDYADIDLLLIKEEGEYTVQYVDDGIPSLTLSRYYDQMYQKATEKQTRSYLKKHHRNANLFIEGIKLRRSMILDIARCLVKVQKDFLDFGEKWKKPLTMKEVAEELNISESSVSRTVNGKFMASAKGIISLRDFFAHGFTSRYGLKHSVNTIKDKINSIIRSEPPQKPHSDQAVADKLRELGIDISRRTIRNYRDELKIPSSSQRKKQYQINKK